MYMRGGQSYLIIYIYLQIRYSIINCIVTIIVNCPSIRLLTNKNSSASTNSESDNDPVSDQHKTKTIRCHFSFGSLSNHERQQPVRAKRHARSKKQHLCAFLLSIFSDRNQTNLQFPTISEESIKELFSTVRSWLFCVRLFVLLC